MAERANPTVVGGFVVGAIVLAIVGLLLFGGGKMFRETFSCVMYFSGSVAGLTVGSPVTFMGVRIGEVTDIRMIADPDALTFLIPVTVEIERTELSLIRDGKMVKGQLSAKPGEALSRLVPKGLRAQLRVRSMVTGQLEVALALRPETPIRYMDPIGGRLEIPTVPSSKEELSRKIEDLPIEELLQSTLATIKDIQKLVNVPELAGSFRSADEALKEVRKTLAETRVSVEGAVTDIQKLTRNINEKLDPLSTNLAEALKNASKTLTQAEQSLRAVEATMGEHSDTRRELTEALRQVSDAAEAAKALADTLERHPESLLRGKRGE